MKPERKAELRGLWCHPRNEGTLVCADVHKMLDEIDRLEGLVRERHTLDSFHDDHERRVEWACTCRKWKALAVDATKFYGDGPRLKEGEAKEEHAAHIDTLIRGAD